MCSNLGVVLTVVAASVLHATTVQAAEDRGRGHSHHDFPPAVHAFHEVMAPIWHGPGGDEGIRAVCRDAGKMYELAQGIVDAPPPQGVDSDGWRHSADALRDRAAAITERCQAGDTGTLSQTFTDLHHAFHGLVRHVGHRH